MIHAALSLDEARAGMNALAPRIERYAALIVRKGVNVQPGQEVVVQSPVDTREFARLLVREAYRAGAGHVTVIWNDDEVRRMMFENEDIDRLSVTPEWQRLQLDSLARAGACFIFVEGSDPSALTGIDPLKPAACARARNTQCRDFRRGLDFNLNPWCIAGAPVAAWARQVFPREKEDEVAIYRLWCAILSAARADGDDPESDWEFHAAAFDKNLRFLNDRHFDALRYKADNGTDILVGLTDGHVWAGGKSETPDGIPFFPNIPTEEVYTSPDRMRVDGIVYSALPLIHQGNTIDHFWLRFKDGAVVDYGAERGLASLRSVIESDEGSRRLGEIALISKNTPIRINGTLFYDTLYDENASCHMALGLGFPECYEGGCGLSQEELLSRGVNQSSTHVDFMMGTDDLDIVGVHADGTEEPIFVNGQWSWE